MKKIIMMLFLCLFISKLKAQDISFYLWISDKDEIIGYNSGIPEFNSSSINDIFDSYTISHFSKAFPLSEYEYMHDVYLVKCDSIGLAEELYAEDSILFNRYSEIPEAYSNATYPDDWYDPGNPFVNDTSHLSLINAPEAWDVSTGNPNIIIGITDTYFDLNHEDMQGGKYHYVRNNVSTSSAHGTFVAGLIAANTNNDTGTAAIGYNCRLAVANKEPRANESFALASDTNLTNDTNITFRVLNLSWKYATYNNLYFDQYHPSYIYDDIGAFNELYERGFVVVCAAGNGRSVNDTNNRPWYYDFPASLDHNISVTSVGHRNSSGTTNVINIHQYDINDSFTNCHHHNNRVDLCAPGYDVTSHYYSSSSSTKYSTATGTSFAAPQVAGTVGLMLSRMSWLTPYQVEYILKKSSTDIYSITQNQKYYDGSSRYTSRLGAGVLNAGAAMDSLQVDSFIHDHPTTTTFKIKGVKLSHKCAPGAKSGVANPRIEVLLENGVPPYTFKWEALNGGNKGNNYFVFPRLDSTGVTQIIGTITSEISSSGTNYFNYRLTVYDNSDIQKVANKIVTLQLYKKSDTTKFDLVMQDAYSDLYDEPNEMNLRSPLDWDYWTSPDVWNRHAQDGDTIHQNPDTTVTNYMHVRIKNVGCVSSPGDPDSIKVKLYWTLASTGEFWPDDWHGTSPQINGHDVGELINPGGTQVPALAPGADTILSEPWMPPNPHDYDTTGKLDTIEVCALARIITDKYSSDSGMTFTEIDTTKINVRNNNNIVTRNFVSLNLEDGPVPRPTGVVIGGLGSSGSGTYTVQMITQNQLQPFIAGHLASYMKTTLYLGDLYDEWDAGGKKGNATEYDDLAKTVTWDMEKELRLENITLDYDERYYVIIEYSLKSANVTVPYKINGQLIHLRMTSPETVTIDNGDGTTFNVTRDYVHSAVNYAINIESTVEGGVGDKPGKTKVGTIEDESYFEIFPNPVNKNLHIKLSENINDIQKVMVLDVNGRVIVEQENVAFNNGLHEISTAKLLSGIYFINLIDNTGISHIKRFVKID